MTAAFEYRQAIVMRTDCAGEQVVTIEKEVVHGDRSCDVGRRSVNEIDGMTRGDMLEHHSERRQFLAQRLEQCLDKNFFAIENIDFMIGDLTVNQERHTKS